MNPLPQKSKPFYQRCELYVEIKLKIFRHFSLNTTIWFPGSAGSAWEPDELQALPGLCDK